MEKVDLFLCEYPGCGKRFTKRIRLIAHKFLHGNSTEKPYKCNVEGCIASYILNAHLLRHQRNIHSGPDGPIKCKVEGCLATFDSEIRCRAHANRAHFTETRKTRVPVEIYFCEICKAEFSKEYRLQEHSSAHTKQKPFKCERCGEEFDFYNTFKAHDLAHRKEDERKKREASCDKCGLIFHTSKGLMIHKKLKHPIVHKCNQCGLCFPSRGNLNAHVGTHSKIRTVFMCTFEKCSKTYYYERGLTVHIQRVHQKVYHTCPYCDKKLSSKQKLDSHIKLHDWIPKVLPPHKPPKTPVRKSKARERIIKHLKSSIDPEDLFLCKSNGRRKKKIDPSHPIVSRKSDSGSEVLSDSSQSQIFSSQNPTVETFDDSGDKICNLKIDMNYKYSDTPQNNSWVPEPKILMGSPILETHTVVINQDQY